MKYLKIEKQGEAIINNVLDLMLKGNGINSLGIANEFINFYNKNLIDEKDIIGKKDVADEKDVVDEKI